jgi:hypothetical protein
VLDAIANIASLRNVVLHHIICETPLTESAPTESRGFSSGAGGRQEGGEKDPNVDGPNADQIPTWMDGTRPKADGKKGTKVPKQEGERRGASSPWRHLSVLARGCPHLAHLDLQVWGEGKGGRGRER